QVATHHLPPKTCQVAKRALCTSFLVTTYARFARKSAPFRIRSARPLAKEKGDISRLVPQKQKSSVNGSGVEVSEKLVTSLLALSAAAWLFGSPSVPRFFISPFRHRKACRTVSPGRSHRQPPRLYCLGIGLAKRAAQRAEVRDVARRL